MFKLRKKTKKTVESPAAMLKRVEAEIKAEELRAAHAAKMAETRESLRRKRAETLSVEAETIKTERQARNEELRDRLINYGPLVIISGLAIVGQYGKFSQIMTGYFGPVLGASVSVLCAVALEMIALFLGLHALKALRRKDSAAGLLIGATVVAGIVAWMNYTYFTGTVGITFALFSFVAPFMWRIKIRSDHRNELYANGEIDTRGLKIERVRWIMHPIKSFKVYRHAAWTGQRDVALAIKEWESDAADAITAKAVTPDEIDMLHAMIEDLRMTVNRPADETGETPKIETPKRPALPTGNSNGHGYPTHHPKWNEGVAKYDASIDSGNRMTQAELASELGMSNRVLAGQIQRYVHEMRERKAVERHNGSDLATETA